MTHIYDMIIIGGGPAGYTAALYASRAGMDVLVMERAAAGGQMALTNIVDNYPGFDKGIDGFTLGVKMQQTAERFGAKTEYAEVTSVDFTEKVKSVHTADGSYFGKTVVIATGANPRELGLPNERAFRGRGIHYCAHCDGRFYSDKTVMVVGGGNSAVADALYLSQITKKVYVVHRRDSLSASKIDRDALMKAENVTFLWNSTVSDFRTDRRITGANIKNRSTGAECMLDLDGVFISIGRKPATAFLQGILKLDDSSYIMADETTQTAIGGVFAAGDVRTKPLRQIVTAVSDGATAAHFAEAYWANLK